MPRYDVSVDATQDEIAEAWAALGFVVLDLHRAAATFAFRFDGKIYFGGLADLSCHRGVCSVFVECKAPGGKLNDAEEAFRDMCLGAGIPYFVEYNAAAAARDAEQVRDWALAVIPREVPGT